MVKKRVAEPSFVPHGCEENFVKGVDGGCSHDTVGNFGLVRRAQPQPHTHEGVHDIVQRSVPW